MLFTAATSNGWMIETFDITAAYLHGEIDKDMWVIKAGVANLLDQHMAQLQLSLIDQYCGQASVKPPLPPQLFMPNSWHLDGQLDTLFG